MLTYFIKGNRLYPISRGFSSLPVFYTKMRSLLLVKNLQNPSIRIF